MDGRHVDLTGATLRQIDYSYSSTSFFSLAAQPLTFLASPPSSLVGYSS